VEPSNTAPLTYEGLELLANTLSRDPKEFDRNVYSQQTQMDKLRESWTKLTESDQKYALQKFALLFPRTRKDPRPQDCLRKIIELREKKDAYRALRVGQNKLPAFDVAPGEDILPTTGWFGRYLEHTRWNEVPLAMHFWAALAILSVACRRNYYQDIDASFLWMNQYILLTGPKGNGKSAAKDIAEDILVRMNRKLAEKEDRKEIPNARTYQPQILPSDITPHSIIEELALMSETPRFWATGSGQQLGEAVAVIISDEFSNTAGKGTYGSALLIPLLTELAFKDRYTKSTKTDGKQIIERVALSLLACTQPGWMRNTIVSDAMEGGFVERANFIYRPASKRAIGPYSIPTLDPLVTEELADFLVDVAHHPSDPQILMPTSEAKDFIDDWYLREHAKGPRDQTDESLHSLHRRQLHVIRMASMLAVSEQDSLPWVEERLYRQAIRILDAEEEHYREFVSQASEGSEAMMGRKILAWVTNHGGCVAKRKLAANLPFKNWESRQRNQALDNLINDTRDLFCASGSGGKWLRIPGVEWTEESGINE
jgi:hypothetical protein